MWVSPQWQRFRGYTTPVNLTQEITVFLLHSRSLKGFIYKYGHASDLKTITPPESQVRKKKRIKIRPFCRERCWKALLCPDIVQSDEQTDTWEQSKNVYYSQQEQSVWTPQRLRTSSVLRCSERKKTLKTGLSSFSHLHNWPYSLETAILKLDKQN